MYIGCEYISVSLPIVQLEKSEWDYKRRAYKFRRWRLFSKSSSRDCIPCINSFVQQRSFDFRKRRSNCWSTRSRCVPPSQHMLNTFRAIVSPQNRQHGGNIRWRITRGVVVTLLYTRQKLESDRSAIMGRRIFVCIFSDGVRSASNSFTIASYYSRAGAIIDRSQSNSTRDIRRYNRNGGCGKCEYP